jgi:hypothetical protein
VTVTAIDTDGNDIASFNATLQTASVSQTSSATPLLSFSSSDRERLSKAMSTDQKFAYLKVSLVGDWSVAITSDSGKSSTTVRVTEFRLTKSADSNPTYLLSTWTDVDTTTCVGVKTLSADTLKKSSMN